MKHTIIIAATSATLLGNNALCKEIDLRQRVILDERIGHKIPEGLTFTDEEGKAVSLERLIDKPTIISFVYLRCGNACPLLLGNLAGALGKTGLVPGEDYRVITVSFDADDEPEEAAAKKKNYIKAAGDAFPADSWKFLTGDPENIRRLAEAVGFRFARERSGFSHPKGLIFLSPGGSVRRYLHGALFQPFDVKMALTESQDKISLSKLSLFSFSYDHDENRYLFNFLKVLGTVFSSFLASLVFFYALNRKKSSKKAEVYE